MKRRKTRSSHLCDHKGLGLSQQANFDESGPDPDRDTARKVVKALLGLAQKCVDSYESTLLAKYNMDGNALLAK